MLRKLFEIFVLFSLVVLSSSSSLIAQTGTEGPTVVLIPEESPVGIVINVIVIGKCTGQVVISVGIPGVPDIDLSNMPHGGSRRIGTGKFLYPGHHLLLWSIRENLPTMACPSLGTRLLYPTRFIVGDGNFTGREPRLVMRDGKPSVIFEEKEERLRIGLDLSSPADTQIYIIQPFPNRTSTIEDFVVPATPVWFGYSFLSVPTSKMTSRLPILFWMYSGSMATVGHIHQPQ